MIRPAASLACAVLMCAAVAPAATTTTWEMNSYQDFVKGRFSAWRWIVMAVCCWRPS